MNKKRDKVHELPVDTLSLYQEQKRVHDIVTPFDTLSLYHEQKFVHDLVAPFDTLSLYHNFTWYRYAILLH